MAARLTTRLTAILDRRAIHPKFHAEFRRLVEQGTRPGEELRTRLECAVNYRVALDEMMAELPKMFDHQFPPAGWQPPADYQYESLTPEDINQLLPST